RDACPDFYIYGLVITDVEWVRTCIKLIELELAGPADLEAIRTDPTALAAMAELLALKETAPGRPANAAVFGRFAADDTGEPVPRLIDYSVLGCEAAPEDDGVLCLGYQPAGVADLLQSRAVIRRGVLRVVDAVAAGAGPRARA